MDTLEQLRKMDFTTFLDFPAIFPIRKRPYLKIFEDGRVSLYGELRKLASERQRDYCARLSTDGRCVALYPKLTPNIHFHADGISSRNERLSRLLLDQGLQLPAIYELEWFEQEQAWVGCCKDLPEPNITAIRQSVKRSPKKGKQ